MLCFITRGIPGSGKSCAVANLVTHRYQDAVVCSADDYRMVKGVYTATKETNQHAHTKCWEKFVDALDDRKVVFVDNTNIKHAHYKPYVDLATKRDYQVTMLMPATPWAYDPVECATRNKHGVPLAVIRGMLKNLIEEGFFPAVPVKAAA